MALIEIDDGDVALPLLKSRTAQRMAITLSNPGQQHVKVLQSLERLRQLEVRFEESTLARLPTGLWRLPRLRRLSITFWESRSGALTGIGALEDLEELTIETDEATPFVALPRDLGELKRLKRLRIVAPQLERLPSTMGGLTALLELDLRAPLASLPPSIGQLRQLRSLKIQGHALRRLPISIGGLTSLRELEINGADGLSSDRRSPLAKLPEQLGALRSLRHLTVSSNHLTELPRSIVELNKLLSLHLAHNDVSTLPDGFEKLRALRVLKLSHNRFTSLPPVLDHVPVLSFLSLTGNEFSTEAFAALKAFEDRYVILVDRPRVKRTARPPPPSSVPLSPAVIEALARLDIKMTPKAAAPRRRTIRVAGGTYVVPEALRQLLWDVRWPTGTWLSKRLHDGDRCEVRFVKPNAAAEYECTRANPYVALAADEFHSYCLIRLDDPKPDDPTLHMIDHDEFRATEAMDLGVRLTSFLRDLRPKRT